MTYFGYTAMCEQTPVSQLVTRLERAIGVIYRPQTERQSHYFQARMADQFDGVIHAEKTRVLEPLERTARWEEVPETYPFAV